MPLMERVATLLRANVNDMLDRAEDPEKLGRQLVLDMENQLLQVKTQVAMALADQHLLEKKRSEQEQLITDWKRKAELAVSKCDDELARAALERSLTHSRLLEGFDSQVADQTAETESLRSTYLKLQSKLADTRGECDLLLAQHRRARLVRDLHAKPLHGGGQTRGAGPQAMSRMQAQVEGRAAESRALHRVARESTLEERLARIETEDRVTQLLEELKAKKNLAAAS